MLGSSKLPNEFDFAKVRAYYNCPEKQKLDDDTRLQKLEFMVLSLSRELQDEKNANAELKNKLGEIEEKVGKIRFGVVSFKLFILKTLLCLFIFKIFQYFCLGISKLC